MLRRKLRGKARVQREIVVALAEHEEGLAEEMRELDALMNRDYCWNGEVVPKSSGRFIFAKLAKARRVALEMMAGEAAAWREW